MSNPNDLMKLALELAGKGQGWVSPNPMVGAIIIKNGKIIGQGFHEKYGENHAEINALNSCKASPKNASIFVTLEPCCHFGKTPPCTHAIIESGIEKVFIGLKDPSEKISGKGIDELKKAGIKVFSGFLENEIREQNIHFFTFHEKKRPFISLKVAFSQDGKISRDKSEKTPITSEVANIFTHKLRHDHQAILVGAGTVISDNPHLGVRLIKGRDPLRIILSGLREIPKKSQIFRNENFLIFHNKTIVEILGALYEKNVISLLIEGGQEVFSSFINAKCIDKLYLISSPIKLGESAYPFLKKNIKLSFSQENVQQLGKDHLIVATPKWD